MPDVEATPSLPTPPSAPTTDASSTPPAPTNPTPPAGKTVEQQHLDIFNRLAGEEVVADAPAPSEPAKPVAEVKAETKAGEPPAPESKPADDSKVEPAKLDKARNALKRWKYPEDVLAGLPPERVLELGQAAMTQQAEQDRVGNQRAELQKMLAEIEREKQAKAVTPEPDDISDGRTASQAAAALDGDQSIDSLLEAIKTDELTAVAYEPLKSAFAKQQAAYEKALKAERETVEMELNRAYEQQDRVLLKLARAELKDEFPQLKDPEKFKAVEARVRSLANLTGYRDEHGVADVERCMRDAAMLEFGAENQKQIQAKLADRRQSVIAGQPSVKTERTLPATGLTVEAAHAAAWQKLQSGKRPDEVRADLASATAE